MQIQLSDTDIKKMPSFLRSELLVWLSHSSLKTAQRLIRDASAENSEQLTLDMNGQGVSQVSSSAGGLIAPSSRLPGSSKVNQKKAAYVRLTQLFDAGITSAGIPVRVRLLKEKEKRLGYRYVTANIEISPMGTIIYRGEEFHKPSPLAAQINGSAVNGWDYIEVQKQGNWVSLNKLRKVWKQAL